MVWAGLFGKRDRSQATIPAAPIVAAPTFREQFPVWINDLDWSVRGSSNILSAEAFAKLRIISDELKELAQFVQSYSIRTDQEHVLKGAVCSDIPDALTLFKQLPAEEQAAGGAADLMLLDQCRNIDRKIRDLNESMKDQVLDALDSHTIFVEKQFTKP